MGNCVVIAIQQLKETSHAKGRAVDNVRILLEVIDECKLKLTTVADEGELQICTDEVARERERERAGARSGTISVIKYAMQFTTKSLREYRIYGHIFVRMLRRSWGEVAKCFVRIWGGQLGWLSVQQHMAQGITNLASAVDSLLVQNAQSNNLQDGLSGRYAQR